MAYAEQNTRYSYPVAQYLYDTMTCGGVRIFVIVLREPIDVAKPS